MGTGYEIAREKAVQAARWGAEILAARREGSQFLAHNKKGKNFLNVLRKSKNPTVSAIQALADWLGMGLEEFIEEAWRHRYQGEEEGLLGAPKVIPSICTRAVEIFARVKIRTGSALLCKDLTALDDLRYSNPLAALTQLENSLESLPGEQIPFALHVAASCFRMVSDFSEAACCLDTSEKLQPRTENPILLGSIKQRWIYLLGAVGYRKAALLRCEEAFWIFSEAGSREKLAESMVDRAYCFYYLDEHDRVEAVCKSVLEMFGDDVGARNKATALQLLATTHARSGRLEEAVQLCLEAFEAVRHERNPLVSGQLLWLLGKFRAKSRLEEARGYLFQAANMLKAVSPLDSLLVLLDYFQLDCESGRQVEDIDRLTEHLAPIADIEKIAHVVENLVALVRLRRLTADALIGAQKQIEACRQLVFRRPGAVK